MKKVRSYILLLFLTFGVNAFCSQQSFPEKNQSLPETVTISSEMLMDKIKGGWAGQTIGCTYGGPTEFKYNGTMIQDYIPIDWSDGCIKWWYENVPGLYDDVYMDLTFVDVFNRLGLDAPIDSFALAFAKAQYPLWHANQAARYNILQGIRPPESGHWLNNPHADDIDYQIEADYAGLMSPGMPNTASEISDKIGHIMNYGNGWYGGVYVGAMYSLAFVLDNPMDIVTEAILEGLDTAFLDRIIESPLHESLIYGRELDILFLQGIRNRYTDLVKYAVSRGTGVDRLYGIGYGEEFTPIMLTRGYARIIDGRHVWIPGDPETAEYLVSIGANVLQENTNGHNFLDLLFFSDNDCGDGDYIPSGTLCRISARKFNRTCSLIELCLERGAKIRKSPKYGLYPYAVCISSVYEKMPEYLDTLLRVRPECFEDYTGARLERDEVNRAISEGIAVNDDDDGTFRIGAGREEFNTAAGQRIRTELRCRIRAVLTGERNESGRYGEYLLSYIRLAGAEEAFFKKIRRYENPLVKMLMNCRPKNVVSYAALDIAAKILKL